MGIQGIQAPFHKLPPFSVLANQFPGTGKGGRGEKAPKEFLHQIGKTEQGFLPFFRIFYRQYMINHRFHGFPFSIMDQLAFHDPSSPSLQLQI